MVRPGIGLFGGDATNTPSIEKVRPVIELHAPVLQIKNIKQGDNLGYNALFTAKKDMKIAIVSAGYADGIPLSLSGSNKSIISHARIGKENAPILGRVSMDYTILDISDLKKYVQRGEKAIFFGASLDRSSSPSQDDKLRNPHPFRAKMQTGLHSRLTISLSRRDLHNCIF